MQRKLFIIHFTKKKRYILHVFIHTFDIIYECRIENLREFTRVARCLSLPIRVVKVQIERWEGKLELFGSLVEASCLVAVLYGAFLW